ncbi:VTT domain-containing protein [Myxococcus sp. RHSTA-1-4]|uniref:TVP38/TMEM64 family protein n=1 Tax=Myxococcus sp. RHSTA-1-4 TaxID=2874601 RepID=UPI001CBD479A
MARSAKTWLRVLAPMLVSVGGLVMLRLLGPDFIDQKRIAAVLEPLGEAAPLAYIAFLAIRPVTLLPGQLLTAVGGMMFGTLAATLYSLTGSFLSAMLLFGVSRKLGTRLMKRLAGGKYPALSRAAKRHDFLFALLSCINPLFPTDVMLVAAASSGARLWPSMAGIMLGTIPGTFLTAQFGSGLAQGRTVMTVVSAVGLVASLVLGVFIGRRLYKELNDAPEEEPERPARDASAVPAGASPVARVRPGTSKQDGVPATW